MNYQFFTDSEKAWKSMFETMRDAKKSIYLEMYIFDNDIDGFDFIHLLKEKSKLGLQVKLILDSFGSVGLSDETISELKQAGVEILMLSYLLHRMHRKILVVDERVAFVGGVNIQQTSRFWDDLMVRITGRLVKKVFMSFVKSYMNAGGKDPAILSQNSKNRKLKTDAWIVEHYPAGNKFHLKKIYQEYLNEAQQSIILITPYFIPKRWLSAALHQAVLRKISVEVLTPKTTGYFFIDRVNYFYIYKLSKLGVKFYMEEKMNHAKAILIDKKEAMVGSQNLDFLSFDLNSEVGVFFKEKKAISQLNQIVENWKKSAILFDHQIYKPKWFDYIIAPIINIFSFFSRIFLD